MTTTSEPSTQHPDGVGKTRHNLGVTSIVFMVMAAAAPMTVMIATVPFIISASGTIAAPAYFVAAGVILVLFSVGFTLMAKHVRNAGAFYSYIQAGLGRIFGAGSAWLSIGSYLLLMVGITTYLGVATENVVAHYTGVDLPWWLWALFFLVVVGILGRLEITLSSKVLLVLLGLEILAVAVLDLGILVNGGDSGLNLEPFAPAQLFSGAPGLGLMFAFLAFIGFEATAVFRDEARDPSRTIPRATYVAVISIALLYAVSSWAVIVGAGTSKAVEAAGADPVNFTLNLAERYVGTFLSDAMQILVATSFFACVLSFHNVIARYAYTLGLKGLLPHGLSDLHPRHHAPSRASLVASIIAISAVAIVAIAQMDPVTQIYTWFTGAATLGIVAIMAITCLAVIVFFRRLKHPSVWKSVIAPALGFIGLLIVVIMIVTNYPLLTGSVTASIVITIFLVLLFVGGAIVAMVMRTRDPVKFQNMQTERDVVYAIDVDDSTFKDSDAGTGVKGSA